MPVPRPMTATVPKPALALARGGEWPAKSGPPGIVVGGRLRAAPSRRAGRRADRSAVDGGAVEQEAVAVGGVGDLVHAEEAARLLDRDDDPDARRR